MHRKLLKYIPYTLFINLFTYIMKLSCISDYIASNGRLVSELSIEENVERSIHDLIWRTNLEYAWRGWEKSRKKET